MDPSQGNTNRRLDPRKLQDAYVPTEEEVKILRECISESFWYRSVPFSLMSMATTQALISKGILTSSSRFGSLPKLAFAGFFGYIAGKISYINVCRAKLMKVHNAPVDEQGQKRQIPISPDVPTTYPIQSFTPTVDDSTNNVYSSSFDSSAGVVPFSSSMSESSPSGIVYNTERESQPVPEERSKPKTVTYDELRSNNRDPYHVTGPPTQRTPQRMPAEDKTPWKKDKKNQYGDVWEE
ncbi:OCIA domain-containing protein 1 [Mixophyes fleayi]|uniref:OCIA domain-containing protein 1 n=1 Tax=Mixophyes fleayi TaxID=3061075 RepID=UPI003F4D8317